MEIVLTQDNYKYLIYSSDYIGQCLKTYGWFSPTEILFLKKYISSEDNIIEIGANIGSHCIPLSKFNSKGKYFCFEPQIDIFKMLVTNASLNNCDNVIPYNYGVGKTSETVWYKFNTKDTNRGGFVIPGNQGADKSDTFLKVRPINYFDELDILNNIKLVKIDVEGYEYDVVRSLESMILKYQPILFIEYNFETFKNVCDYLKSISYKVYYFNTSDNQYNRVIGKEDYLLRTGDVNVVAFPSSFNNIPSYLNEVGNEDRPNTNIYVSLDDVN